MSACVRLGGRVALARDRVELAPRCTRRAAGSRCTRCRTARAGGPSRFSISFATRGTSGESSDLARASPARAPRGSRGLVEAARDQRRRGRRVRIDELRGAGSRRGSSRSGCRARARRCRRRRRVPSVASSSTGGGVHLVRERIPVDVRVVDDGVRDRLVDDALHHLRDRALLRRGRPCVAVVGLDLVAQVPVLEQAHLRAGTGARPSSSTRWCIQML